RRHRSAATPPSRGGWPTPPRPAWRTSGPAFGTMSWCSCADPQESALTSETRAEREAEAVALGRARELDARHGARQRVNREADPVDLLQPGEVEIRGASRDLAGVEEQRHVDERSGGPAVLTGEQQPVAI